MNVSEASRIILGPHTTEKTSMMVELQATICLLVEKTASKPEIAEAVDLIYNAKVRRVTTARTISGKKAFVKFESVEKARGLASDIGML